MQVVYLDESYDQAAPYFVMSGYGASPEQWEEFSKKWLEATRSIHYIKMSDANGWSLERRKEYFPYLHNLIVEHVNFAVQVVVDRQALREYYADVPPINANPYYFCFFRVLEKVAGRFGHPVGMGDLQFVFDEQIGADTRIAKEWGGFLERCPPHLRDRIKNSPVFKADDDCAPLQAADFRAWFARVQINTEWAGGTFELELKPKRHLTVLDSTWDRGKLYEAKQNNYNPASPSGIPEVPGGLGIRIGPF